LHFKEKGGKRGKQNRNLKLEVLKDRES
jgi:hypothetical protein